MGLDGVLRKRANLLTGILNGIDPAVWNPATDAHLASRYRRDGSPLARRTRRRSSPLRPRRRSRRVPARRGEPPTEQKGIDLVAGAVPHIVGTGAQLAVLGRATRRSRDDSSQLPGVIPAAWRP